MTDHNDFEELEQIPWAALAADTRNPRNRYLAFAALGVAAVFALGWLVVRGGGAQAAPATPMTTAAPAAPVATSAPTTTVASAVYSEADLMAIDVAAEVRLAVMHAEWLARDYLTVDDDPIVADRIAELLPDVERGDTGTYVEWVSPYAVSSPEPGRYRVELVYRLLIQAETGFVRQPASALAVELALDPDGSARIAAVPETIPVPELKPLAAG